MKYPIYWPQYFIATLLEWKHILKQVKYKNIIVENLRFTSAVGETHNSGKTKLSYSK